MKLQMNVEMRNDKKLVETIWLFICHKKSVCPYTYRSSNQWYIQTKDVVKQKIDTSTVYEVYFYIYNGRVLTSKNQLT